MRLTTAFSVGWLVFGFAIFLIAPGGEGLEVSFICYAISNVWSAASWIDTQNRKVALR